MLLKPYNVLNDNGGDPYKQSYIGKVVDNNDPSKLKRVKVYISVWEMLTDDQLQWVSPESSTSASSNSDNHNVPEVGSTVKVFFENGDPENPRYTGAGVTEDTKCTLYDEDYPNTYGTKDSIGNFTMHNKRTGISVWHHNSGTHAQFDADGTFTVFSKNGCYVTCSPNGAFKISGTKFTVTADESINLNATRINLVADNVLDIKADNISVNGNTGIKVTTPQMTFGGTKCDFNNDAVFVNNAFSITSCPGYTLKDPFSKVTCEWESGVLKSKEKW